MFIGGIMFKAYRIKRGYTQETLAEILNISTRHLQRIENNENEPSLELLKKIIKILNIDDKDLVKNLKK